MVLFMTMCVGVSSCKKDDEGNGGDPKTFAKQIVGKWRYYAYYDNGWNYVGDYCDRKQYIQFNSDGTYREDVNFCPPPYDYNNNSFYFLWSVKGESSSGTDVYTIVLKTNPNPKYEDATRNNFNYYLDDNDKIGVYERDFYFKNSTDTLQKAIGYYSYLYVREK